MSLENKLVSEINEIKAKVSELTSITQSSSEQHLLFDLSEDEKKEVASKDSRRRILSSSVYNRERAVARAEEALKNAERELERARQDLLRVDQKLIELRSKQARLKTEGQVVTVRKQGRELNRSEREQLITLRAREAELRATARKFSIDV